MNVRPDVQAFTDVDGFAQLDSQLDPAGNLHGVRLLDTFLDEDGVSETPDCGWKDDPGPRITCVGRQLTVEEC